MPLSCMISTKSELTVRWRKFSQVYPADDQLDSTEPQQHGRFASVNDWLSAEPDVNCDPVELARQRVVDSQASLRDSFTKEDLHKRCGILPRLCSTQSCVVDGVLQRTLVVFEWDDERCSACPLDLDIPNLKESEHGTFTHRDVFPPLYDTTTGTLKNLTTKMDLASPSLQEGNESVQEMCTLLLKAVHDAAADYISRLSIDGMQLIRLGQDIHLLRDDPSQQGFKWTASISMQPLGFSVVSEFEDSHLQTLGASPQDPALVYLSPINKRVKFVRLYGSTSVGESNLLRLQPRPNSQTARKLRRLVGLRKRLQKLLRTNRKFEHWSLFEADDHCIVWPNELCLVNSWPEKTSPDPRPSLASATIDEIAIATGPYIEQLYRERDQDKSKLATQLQTESTSISHAYPFLPSYMPVDALTPRTISDANLSPENDPLQIKASPDKTPAHLQPKQTAQTATTDTTRAKPANMDVEEWTFAQPASTHDFWSDFNHRTRNDDDTNIFETMGGGLTEDDFDFFDRPPSLATRTAAATPAAASVGESIQSDMPIPLNGMSAAQAGSGPFESRTPYSYSTESPAPATSGPVQSPALFQQVQDSPATVSAAASPYKVGLTPMSTITDILSPGLNEENSEDSVHESLKSIFNTVKIEEPILAIDKRYPAALHLVRHKSSQPVFRPSSPNLDRRLSSTSILKSPERNRLKRSWRQTRGIDDESSGDEDADKPFAKQRRLSKQDDSLLCPELLLLDDQDGAITLGQALECTPRKSKLPFDLALTISSPRSNLKPSRVERERCRQFAEVANRLVGQDQALSIPIPNNQIKVIRSCSVIQIDSRAVDDWSQALLEPLSGPKKAKVFGICAQQAAMPLVTEWLKLVKQAYQACNLGGMDVACTADESNTLHVPTSEMKSRLAHLLMLLSSQADAERIVLFIPAVDFIVDHVAHIAHTLSKLHNVSIVYATAEEMPVKKGGTATIQNIYRIAMRTYDMLPLSSSPALGKEMMHNLTYRPLLTLVPIKQPRITFSLDWPIRSLRPADRHRFLHASYRFVAERKSILVCCDDLGEGYSIQTIDHTSDRLTDKIHTIWHAIRTYAAQASVEWRITVVPAAAINKEELSSWNSCLRATLPIEELCYHLSLLSLQTHPTTLSAPTHQSSSTLTHSLPCVVDGLQNLASSRISTNDNHDLFSSFSYHLLAMSQSAMSLLDIPLSEHMQDIGQSFSGQIQIGRMRAWPTSVFAYGQSVSVPWHVAFIRQL